MPIDSNATADAINGHEWDTSKLSPAPNSDLQYACVFPLMTPRACGGPDDCDCSAPISGTIADLKNPLCQDLGTNQYSTNQSRAKAYPGIRELQVLEGLGDQAIVASICPANVTDDKRSDYGFRPAIAALLHGVRTPLRTCF